MTLTQAPVPVISTLLAKVIYSASEWILQLEFCDGALYHYFAVPEDIYKGLLAADSKGEYFNRQIRNRFAYVLLRRPQ